MSFFGKEYKFVNDENFQDFLGALKSTGFSPDSLEKYQDYKPTSKIEKDGDTYTLSTIFPQKTKTIKFKSGEGVEEEVKEGLKLYNLFTVDGNTITQIVKRNKDDTNYLSLKREFDGDKMTIIVTASFWDGTSYRHYKA